MMNWEIFVRRRAAQGLACSFAFIISAGAGVFAQGTYKITSANQIPSDVPAAVSGVLNAQGTTLNDGTGSPVSSIWWAKTIAATPGGSADAAYPDLAVGTFLGLPRPEDQAWNLHAPLRAHSTGREPHGRESLSGFRSADTRGVRH